MATTTPNYGWPVPTSTDLVKDGAVAIEALGDAIDATVFGLGSSGLTLVKAQTIGTAVSSVNVTSAFSSTYDNYLVVLSGGVGSTAADLNLKLGATTTGYYAGRSRVSYAGVASAAGVNNGTAFNSIGFVSTNTLFAYFNLNNPFNTKNTFMNALTSEPATAASAGYNCGYLNDSTSYTDFTLTPTAGTLTGGVIRVYGYKNS